jgi:cellulose synthase/poly-beta-1,6-N-acetylglucosamine synthase-like glycosyltransferase
MIEVLSLAVSGCLLLFAFANLWLVIFHLRHRQEMARREKNLIQPATLQRQGYPLICVQMAVRNEENVVRDALRSLCSLDWPTDRLEIMVLDDQSTDQTRAIAIQEAALWAEQGLNVRVISLAHRVTKGGALRGSLAETRAEYFAIFDADSRPGRSFLQATMPVLLAEPGLGFVQARIDFANRDTNWVTKAQAVELETYYAFAQTTRNWAGIPTAYNGTAGVWRRQAIVDAGGWTPRSYLEDVDLSLRAFARGWRGWFVTSVSVPGELPESMSDLLTQRLRWKIGWHQQIEVLPWRLLRQLKWHQTLLFLVLFVFDSAAHLLVGLNALLIVLAFALLDPLAAFYLGAAFLFSLGAIVLWKSVGAWLAARQCRRPVVTEVIADLVKMWTVQILLLPGASRAALGMLLGTTRRFEQTPKAGSGA